MERRQTGSVQTVRLGIRSLGYRLARRIGHPAHAVMHGLPTGEGLGSGKTRTSQLQKKYANVGERRGGRRSRSDLTTSTWPSFLFSKLLAQKAGST